MRRDPSSSDMTPYRPWERSWKAQWKRAAAGESGIGALTRFPLREGFPVRIAGQVAEIDIAPYPFLRPREMAHWTSPIFPHALLVVHRALKRAGLEITPEMAPRVAVTFSSAIGGLDALIDADRTLVATGKLPQPFMNPNSCINMAGGKVAILTGATGPIVSSRHRLRHGEQFADPGGDVHRPGDGRRGDLRGRGLSAGRADRGRICDDERGVPPQGRGGTSVPPAAASCPFSLSRRGFVVSEGAGCIVIASRAFAAAHGLPFETELAGWAMTADACHVVAPNPVTVTRCMAESIRHAGISPAEIDAVNAHAASTKVGDQVEADALREVFAGRVPPVSANKSQIGHAMGATSAIESILAMEGMRRGVLLPTINHRPDPAIDLDCVAEGARACRPGIRPEERLRFRRVQCVSCVSPRQLI